MAGHIKFCLLIASGFVMFHEPLSVNQLIGFFLTLAGVISYTHLRVIQLQSIILYMCVYCTVFDYTDEGASCNQRNQKQLMSIGSIILTILKPIVASVQILDF